ncbi:MAG: hypothetical protein C4308_01255 [Chitinophagaceae bacterium]
MVMRKEYSALTNNIQFAMKKFKLTAFFFLVTAFNCFSQSNIDVLHYRFHIELFDSTDMILGKADITLRFTENTSTVKLNLASKQADGKGMEVVKLTGTEIAGFQNNQDTLVLTLSKEAKKNDSVLLSIFYIGIPKDGLIITKRKDGTNSKTFFADNWPNRAHYWIPCNDRPDDKASFEFLVTAPAKYRVVSNGILQEEKLIAGNKKLTHWKEDIPLSTKVMVIGAAQFAVKTYTDSPEKISVSAWVFSSDTLQGFQNYSFAPQILKFFSSYIGPYPYKKLANVQSKTIFGGMENASCIFYYDESATTKKSVEDLLAHEIAHQWFGNMVSEKKFADLWLSEGFATYLTNIYFENKYGRDSMNYRLKKERKEAIDFGRANRHPVVDSTTNLMSLLNANSYQKGGWILHMLRQEAGDTVFKNIIRSFYNQYKGSNASSKDFEAVAEKISGKDLTAFFKQWLYQPGIPQLDIHWKYDNKTKKLCLIVEQKQSGAAFQFPLELRIQSASGKSRLEKLWISNKQQTFNFSSTEPVATVEADPFVNLLFDGRVQKIQ